jgi:3-oxoacyl-[acyl-carrier protein] reductase
MAKTALVTGASGGIGSSIAKRLAKDGFSVVVHYAGKPAPAQAVVADLQAAGGQSIAVQADVANAEDVERLFKESIGAFGRPDVGVHCAGMVFTQAAQHVPDGGRIIAFSSSVLLKSFPNYGAYIASKAGVEGLVHVLANEMRGRNITVNAVAPGQVRTELFLKGKSDALIAELVKMNPLERLGEPEDFARVVSFLAGPEGGWINSQVLQVNGGFVY